MSRVEISNPNILPILVLIIFFHFLSNSPCVYSLSALSPADNESYADRNALLCLESQLHDPSGALASWRNVSFTFCNWHGVKCSARHASRVISLDLESVNISGQIFPCISDLSFLRRIHMPNNQLSGHISHELGRLTRLRYLNLSMNSFSGQIPETISSCSRLKIIDIDGNSIEGEIPASLAHCSCLEEVILSNNYFQGNIPSQFALLPNLSALFIPNNKLTGTIPQLLGSNMPLRWVNLRNNSLTGEIPRSMFNSTSLSYIDLSINDLSGSIPPFSQTSSPLKFLRLAKNKLSGGIPSSIGNISSMSVLIMAQNNLQGRIPDSIGRLISLRTLDLSYNILSGIVPPTLYTISSLTYIDLGANQLAGRIPTDIGYTLASITNLVLEGNQFEGAIPASLANASNLQGLDLRSNAYTGVIPSLGSLNKLTYLDLGANMLEAGDWSFLSSLTNCTQLYQLWLDRNNLEGIMPSTITNLSNSLEKLILLENQFRGSIPSEIGRLTSLTVLQMDRNFLSGHIPDTIGNLENLTILSLSQNKLSGEIPQSIGKLGDLTKLHLEENDLTGNIPASLASCKNLLRLNLSCNNFNGSVPLELFSILTLSEGLDLSYNQIIGHIPSEIGRLINLNSLSISNNQISGEIPSTLSECLVLESLHLEANFLQGSIPGSLSSLRGINVMDLSRNNICGKIPEFFTSFKYLQILNISFNNLDGLVPKGGVFANSSVVFIQGNNKLCASSPTLQVPLCTTSSSKKKILHIVTIIVPLTTTILIILACLATILLKKRVEAKQITYQSFKLFRNFSYGDLFKATDGFSSANLVGSGGFGFVYRGQIMSEACTIAIKVFRLDQFGVRENFITECEVLRNIRHRNLIRVISVCSTFDPSGNEFKALVLEYMGNGNLESWLHPKASNQPLRRSLSLGSRITIAMDIAAALDYLHNRCAPPLAHCDLKPSNVLLDDEMVAYLTDFGLAKFLYGYSSTRLINSSSIAGPRGSVGYIAPEYGTGCKISIKGDVYTYGIVLLEMMTGKRPTDDMFKDSMNLHTFVEATLPHKIDEMLDPNLVRYHGDENTNLATDEMQWCVMQLAKLGLKCSETSPKDRPTMEDVYSEIISIKENFQCHTIEEID